MMRNYHGLLLALCFSLLSLASCSTDVPQPSAPEAITSVDDYFWSTATSALTFVDSSGRTTNSLTFAQNGLQLLASDANASTAFYCTSSKDSARIDSINAGSLFALDDGMYFSALDTLVERSVAHTPVSYAIKDGLPPLALVATDSGLFRYDTTANMLVPYALGTVSDITAISIERNPTQSSDTLYAATRSGKLYTVALPGGGVALAASGLPAGAISAIACGQRDEVFVAVSGTQGIWKLSADRQSWSVVSSFAGSYTVRKLFVVSTIISSVSHRYLAMVATDGSVQFLNLDNGAVSPVTTRSDLTNAMVSYPGGVFAATASGIYEVDPSTNAWSVNSKVPQTSVTSLVGVDQKLFYIASGQLFALTIASGVVTPITPIPSGTLLQFGELPPHAQLIVASTDGVFTTSTSNISWRELPGLKYKDYPRVPGGLLMLKGNLAINSHWRAGTLITEQNHHSYRFTARVVERLDSLQIRSVSYHDVIVVRYAYEKSDDIAEDRTIPYWAVYFQRGHGPIMFEKIRDGAVIDRRSIQ